MQKNYQNLIIGFLVTVKCRGCFFETQYSGLFGHALGWLGHGLNVTYIANCFSGSYCWTLQSF